MSKNKLYKLIGGIFLLTIVGAVFVIYSLLFIVSGGDNQLKFEIEKGETVFGLAQRLNSEGIIYTPVLFRGYLAFKGIDRRIQAGEFMVDPPITIVRIAKVLQQSAERKERTITIIPGWDLRDLAKYFEKEGIAAANELLALVGEPARVYDPPQAAVGKERIAPVFPLAAAVLVDRPLTISYEGYLAPETYRIFSDATLSDVIVKLITERERQFTAAMYQDIKKAGRTSHEVLTVASLVEREVRGQEDRAQVADIFWRRFDAGWALQADSTVHYAVGRKGDVFTTKKERDTDSLWNTYQYQGLPPSPICNPSVESIRAAIYPEKNEYWYFLTTLEGEVKYGRTIEEHNGNVARYLR